METLALRILKITTNRQTYHKSLIYEQVLFLKLEQNSPTLISHRTVYVNTVQERSIQSK